MKYLIILCLLACGKPTNAKPSKPVKPEKEKVYVVHIGVDKYYCKELGFYRNDLNDCELDGDPTVTIETIYNATNYFKTLK